MPEINPQIERIDKRLQRIEKLLTDVIGKVQADPKKRLTEKEVEVEYAVSKNVLRRLRLGYKRIDGVDIPPVLFKWGHRKNRNFDYDREELDAVLRRTLI
jgi:hypothetical protein